MKLSAWVAVAVAALLVWRDEFQGCELMLLLAIFFAIGDLAEATRGRRQ